MQNIEIAGVYPVQINSTENFNLKIQFRSKMPDCDDARLYQFVCCVSEFIVRNPNFDCVCVVVEFNMLITFIMAIGINMFG